MTKNSPHLVSDYFSHYKFVLGGGFESDLMDHLSTEIILMIAGTGRFVLGAHDFRLSSEMVIIANAGEPRFFYPESDDTLLLVFRDTQHHLLTDDAANVQKYSFDHPKSAIKEINLVTAIGKLYVQEQSGHEEKVQTYLNVIRNHLLDFQVPNGHNDDAGVVSIIDYINKNYKEELSLSHLSEVFNFSASYLSRVFKKNTGMGLQEFLQRVRILFARKALIESDENIAVLAEENGFNYARNMNRIFLRYAGYTPSDARKAFDAHMFPKDPSEVKDLPGLVAFKEWIGTLSLSLDGQAFIRSYRNVSHEVDSLQPGEAEGDAWSRVGNFWMHGYEFFCGDTDILHQLLEDLEFDKMIFTLTFDAEGHTFLRTAQNKYLEFSRNALTQMLSLIKKYRITPIIHFDILALVPEDMKNASGIDLLSHYIQWIERELRAMMDLAGLKVFKKWYFGYSLPGILDILDDWAVVGKAHQFLVHEYERFLLEIGDTEFNFGVHLGKVGIEDFIKFEKLMEASKSTGLIPKYIAMDLIEFETEPKPFININQKIQRYAEEARRHIDKYLQQPAFSNVEVFVANVCVPYDIPEIPSEYQPAFLNAVALEIMVSTSNYVSSINSATILSRSSGEEEYIDITPLTAEGFKMPLYYTLQQMRTFKGERIYFKEGCYVQRDEVDYRLALYADLDESIMAADQNYEIEVPIEMVDVTLKGLYGRYKVTVRRINLEHGCVSMIKKKFYDGDNQYLNEEYDYIDLIAIPQMEVQMVDLNGALNIKEQLKIFGVSFFHIQKIIAPTSAYFGQTNY